MSLFRILFRVVSISVLISALGCVSPLPDKAPLGASPVSFGDREQREVGNLFVLADASGTTYAAKTFPEIKSLATSLVQALPDSNARGIGSWDAGYTGFGGSDRVSVPLGKFNRSELLSAAGRTEIMGSIDGTGGTTPIHAVLREVANQGDGNPGKTAVVLFSDGMAHDPRRALFVANGLVESRSEPVCFHGVQAGSDPEGTRFLKELAALSSCGSVRNASEVSSASSLQSFAKSVLVGPAGVKKTVARTPDACSGTIRLRGIQFATDKAAIDAVGAVVLDATIGTLSACPKIRLRVDGHTSSTGPEAYNQALSERRAKAVRNYLASNGIGSSRLSVRGFGETQPVATNDTADGRARNRRVELTPQ